MKVKIGPYKNWFGPYQLAEALCFWVKKVPDEYGISMVYPDWVHEFGEFIAHGFQKPDYDNDNIFNRKDEHQTWLYKLLLWIESKRKREVSIHIDRWDTWSMDHTLALIILPMLKQLKATKHGAPLVDDDDVPEGIGLRSTEAPSKENEYDVDGNHFKRWDWVIDEMIFAFEMKNRDHWEGDYTSGEWDMRSEEETNEKFGKVYKMVEGPNHTYKIDHEAVQAVNKRIANGFQLFGKYYQNLWD